MGHSLSYLLVFLVLAFSPWLPVHRAQLNSSATASARGLDMLLQDYAFRAFVRPKTGVLYDGSVPPNLTGIEISAVRLRSGSLRLRGVKVREFEIPMGIIEEPYEERLVLVYQKLEEKWSSRYYPLEGYTYISPVLGLLAYSAENLLATNLPELNITPSSKPILIHHPVTVPIGDRVPQCVWFDLNGMASFTSVVSSNTCSTTSQGHFALLVNGTIPPPPHSTVPPSTHGQKKHHKTSSKVWIIVGSVLGGLLLLILFAILFAWLKKYEHKKKMQRMEKAADVGEALRVTSVGSAKAPSAVRTRTQPSLETEYVP